VQVSRGWEKRKRHPAEMENWEGKNFRSLRKRRKEKKKKKVDDQRRLEEKFRKGGAFQIMDSG